MLVELRGLRCAAWYMMGCALGIMRFKLFTHLDLHLTVFIYAPGIYFPIHFVTLNYATLNYARRSEFSAALPLYLRDDIDISRLNGITRRVSNRA